MVLFLVACVHNFEGLVTLGYIAAQSTLDMTVRIVYCNLSAGGSANY
jgi:hypothetical protein